MLLAPRGIAADVRPHSAHVREADREIVGLLRQNHKDNREIIALLGQVVQELGLLQLSGSGVPSPEDGDTTGFWGPISET